MSKVDYCLIASVFKAEFRRIASDRITPDLAIIPATSALKCVISELCRKFAERNEQFDTDKFRAACGLRD